MYEGTRSGYAKQQGRDVQELLTELRDHGIHVLASFIVGFDYQTPEIVEEELSGLLKLVPTFTQILIYGPTPGTPFYDRIQKEGRLVDRLRQNREEYYKKCTGFYGMIKHSTLSSEQWEEIQEKCYRKDFEELGPSLIRSVESWFLGYKRLVHAGSPGRVVKSWAALLMACWTSLCLRMNWFQHPRLTRSVYRMGK